MKHAEKWQVDGYFQKKLGLRGEWRSPRAWHGIGLDFPRIQSGHCFGYFMQDLASPWKSRLSVNAHPGRGRGSRDRKCTPTTSALTRLSTLHLRPFSKLSALLKDESTETAISSTSPIIIPPAPNTFPSGKSLRVPPLPPRFRPSLHTHRRIARRSARNNFPATFQ